VHWGTVIFKVHDASGIFGSGKISKTILEKAFFCILSGFFLRSTVASKHSKNGPNDG
jgi:hypothetical protein